MVELKELEDELYVSIYGLPRVGDPDEIWNKIKSNPEILREAVQVKKDKFGERDIVKGYFYFIPPIHNMYFLFVDSPTKKMFFDA